MRSAEDASTRWDTWIDWITTVCAFSTITHATRTASALETIRVFAEFWNDKASTIDAFDDGGDVQREDAYPGEDQEQAEDAADAERREADDAGEQHVTEQPDQLGDHQHDPVLRVPLQLGIRLLHEQRNDTQHPPLAAPDHHATVRGRVRHLVR